MKQKYTLNRFLHNDKWMMLVSLVIAFIIWLMVVYGPGTHEERVISGVPITVNLNEYVVNEYNLRIVDGANATASVKVSGTRSEIASLTAQDITVTADAGQISKEGAYVLPLRATSSGNYSIVSVTGDDGVNNTVTITCDVWREQNFTVKIMMPKLSVSDPEKFQFGTPALSGAAVTGNTVVVAGPRTDINRIARVEAIIAEEEVISETTILEADLVAYDEDDVRVESVSFLLAEDGKVDVTVPVLVYRKVELTPTLKHVPSGYKDTKDLVTVTPSEIEMWCLPTEEEDYIKNIQELLVWDFDRISLDGLIKEVVIGGEDGVRLTNGTEKVTMKLNLDNLYLRTLDIPLTAENLRVSNLPAGLACTPVQKRLTGVKLCGPADALDRIKVEDILLNIELENLSAGKQSVVARLTLPEDTVWVFYEIGTGFEMQVSVDAVKETATSTDKIEKADATIATKTE